MRKILICAVTFTLLLGLISTAQNTKMGSYGEINFQQQLSDTVETEGNLNINRLFLTVKSQLSNKLEFSGAVELNNNKNFFVEHAYLDYKVGDKMSWRNGLVFVPMGKANVDHISTEYYGSLRTANDRFIIPTTWTAYGTGIVGDLTDASVKYQAYILNGLNDIGLNGINGFRAGNQGRSNAEFSTPNFAAKIDFYGFDNLNIGLSAYTGNTNNNINNTIAIGDTIAPSDLSIGMLGIDAQYKENNLFVNGQFLYTEFDGAEGYNAVSNSDLGSKMLGYFLTVGYDYELNNGELLIPYVIFERYATHHEVGLSETVNNVYNRNLTTVGVSYKPGKNVVYKLDYQMYRNDAQTNELNLLNAAVHFAF